MNYQINGNYPGYNGAPPSIPPREPFFTRLFHSAEYAPFRELFLTSCILGLAFLTYPSASNLFSYILSAVPGAGRKYMSDPAFGYLCEAAYSFLCVGAPFLLVYIMLKATGRYRGAMPAGKPYSASAAFLLVFAGLGLCFAGNMITSYMASFFQNLGVEFYSYRQALEGEPMPGDLMTFYAFMLRSAVVPALIEEFAFRGVLLQTLRKYGDWFAIAVSAVMFGLMHANMTQVPFALLAGFGLGYAYVVSGSLWTSVVIHFINNMTSVVYTVISGAYGDGTGMVFTLAATYGFIFLGTLAAVVFCVKNPRFTRLYPGVYAGQRKKGIAFFIAPTTVIAAGVLISYMLADIVR